jgi:septal ring factor EnvC (AmiA/AmiB activator)
LLFIALITLSFPVFPSESDDLSASPEEDMRGYQTKLEKLHQSIEKVKEHLKGTRYKRSHVVTELKKLEGDISRNARKLKQTETLLKSLNDEVSGLRQELAELRDRLQNQRLQLSRQLRAAYAIGHDQQIKMLLNQQNPAETGRVMVYFDYLNRARETQINDFLDTIAAKTRVETELAGAVERQQAKLEQRTRQKRTLYRQRIKRQQLLTQIEDEIRNQEKNLTELEDSRNRIEQLLMSLGELLADIPPGPSDNRPFKSQKGQLPWPAEGPFLATFGQPREQGGLKWKGVLISSAYGSPVRAVSHGRVAFADWLQGFGFITIVDHGDGYMSLYGHNESQFKQAGDWVTTGEVIATIGDSGGQPNAGLYFEIRSRGKPVDPTGWCSGNARFAQVDEDPP